MKYVPTKIFYFLRVSCITSMQQNASAKKKSVFMLTFIKKNRGIGGYECSQTLFKVYLGFTGEESNFNRACPKMTIKTLGQEPKIRVGRV